MGGTLSDAQKEVYCWRTQILFVFESEYWNPTLDVVLLMSSILSCFIGLQIVRHKHLQSSPAPLLAALSFSDSCFTFLGFSRYFVCEGGHIERMVAATVLWDTSEES